MNTYRAAIVGTGGIARAHVQAIRGCLDRVELVACCDIDQQRVETFADEHGIAGRYRELDDLLEREKPDLVHICTPPGLHCKLSVKSLTGGAWVLCEKPLCASLAEMDRIEAAETETGNYCSSVFQLRFGSGSFHLKRLVREESLGRPLVGVCNTTWYRDDAYYAVPWRGKWSTELGGPTMGHGIHTMDLFLWLMGEWDEVRAMMGTLDRDIEVEDVSMAAVRFASGAMGSVVNSILCPRQETYVRLDFQRATVEATYLYHHVNDNWRFTAAPGVPDRQAAAWTAMPADVPSTHQAQLVDLLDSMDKGERPTVSGRGVRPTIEFLTALYKAAITGQPVKRGSISPGDPFYSSIHGGVKRSH